MVRSIRSFALLIALVPVACTFYAKGELDPNQPPPHPYPPSGREDPAPPPRAGSDGRDAGRPAGGYGVPPDAAVAPPDAMPASSSCPGRAVDRWKELLIIDRSVMADALARNDSADAPWSFRRRLEELAGGPDRAADLAYDWLGQWRSLTSVSISAGAPSEARVAVIPRPTVDGELLCPWQRLTPGNGCVTGCAACVDRRLDLVQAPFRLIAIVNRADLGRGEVCGRDGGELRFVYTALRPDTRASLPFTVIFEYRVTLPAGEDRRSWAGAWRALGLLPFGPSFNATLAELIDRALAGATLARVQTNEVALGLPLGMPWEMRQFAPMPLDGGGIALEPSAAAHTPRLSLNDSEELAAWLEQNRRAILEGDNLLRPDMLAGSALIPTADFAWRAPRADPAVLAAFNANSCNGCHGGRRDPADLPFQHVGAAEGSYFDPTAATAPARVSKFLHNPGREDELGRRGAALQAAACAPCGGYPRLLP